MGALMGLKIQLLACESFICGNFLFGKHRTALIQCKFQAGSTEAMKVIDALCELLCECQHL
jgi:hypothetical protein